MKSALDAVRRRWHAIPPARQRALLLGAAALAVVLVALFVWQPAARDRARLTARLPVLARELAAMQSAAAEVRELTRVSAVAPAPRAAADNAALQSLFGEGARVSVAPDRAFKVEIPRIAYAAWWDRATEARERHGLALQSVTLTALPGSAREVAVDMRLTAGK